MVPSTAQAFEPLSCARCGETKRTRGWPLPGLRSAHVVAAIGSRTGSLASETGQLPLRLTYDVGTPGQMCSPEMPQPATQTQKSARDREPQMMGWVETIPNKHLATRSGPHPSPRFYAAFKGSGDLQTVELTLAGLHLRSSFETQKLYIFRDGGQTHRLNVTHAGSPHNCRMYVCMHIYIYIHIHLYIYIILCIHIHINILLQYYVITTLIIMIMIMCHGVVTMIVNSYYGHQYHCTYTVPWIFTQHEEPT